KFQNEDYAYVSTFRVTESERVDTNSEVFLLRIHQPFDGGNGGPMFFADDGYLYIVTGDGGEKDYPKGNAQNKNSFHGKVLRLDVTSGQQDFTEKESGTAKLYGIPGTNPFINSTIARPEIYALGIRNMWGCSQDTVNKKGGTGRIFCAETGINKFDEINLIEAGANYGWNVRQGTACQMTNVAECRPLENERYPIYEFPHNKSHALVGGYVYRGRLFSYLYGIYTFADAVTGKTYLLEEKDQGTWDRRDWLQCHVDKCPSDARETPLKHILAFGQDLKSELYLLMADEFLIGSKTGKMFALLPLKSDTTAPSCYSCLVVTVAMVFSWENIH
ncbi:HHIP-like protein 1, partial [Biomphalaria pfeifferi]